MKTILESESGKRVGFSPKQVDYMTQHGWKKISEPKSESKSKTKPNSAESKK